jgi:hypothetical protein
MPCSNCRAVTHREDCCSYEPISMIPKIIATSHAMMLIEQGKSFEAKPDDEFYQFLVMKEVYTKP